MKCTHGSPNKTVNPKTISVLSVQSFLSFDKTIANGSVVRLLLTILNITDLTVNPLIGCIEQTSET